MLLHLLNFAKVREVAKIAFSAIMPATIGIATSRTSTKANILLPVNFVTFKVAMKPSEKKEDILIEAILAKLSEIKRDLSEIC